MAKQITLTYENASKVTSIISNEHPEWGTKRFSHNEDGLGLSTRGIGSDSSLLYDHEFKFWNIATWK